MASAWLGGLPASPCFRGPVCLYYLVKGLPFWANRLSSKMALNPGLAKC